FGATSVNYDPDEPFTKRSSSPMTYRKKLIEVALPLVAINEASTREKTIRHGHPSTLHLWWARRPLAACRAVLFASLVDDPSSHPERFPTEKDQERERQRLHEIIRNWSSGRTRTTRLCSKRHGTRFLRPPTATRRRCSIRSV